MKDWKVILIAIAGVIAVLFMCVFGVQSSQNKAISLEETISSSKSDANVQEKRRVDLLENLVDCVKQYDEHEYNTLMDVVKERGSGFDEDVTAIENQLDVVVEAYPELKSNENYKQLMLELSTTENLIAQYREAYNKQIKNYNRYVKRFPTRIFLSITGYEVQEYKYLDYGDNADAPKDLFK